MRIGTLNCTDCNGDRIYTGFEDRAEPGSAISLPQESWLRKIYHEKISGASTQRLEYIRMISELRKGDVIVVWRIDRLGRITYELIRLMVECNEMGLDFQSISEGIDTSTKMGRLWYMLSSVFAENEREILMERTLAGMEAARARGR